jgi:hypothetical protein
MLAVEKSPTVHPARVNGTHGAGVCRSVAPGVAGTVSEYTMLGVVSWPGVGGFTVSDTGAFQ